MRDRFISNSEACERLGVSDYRRRQLIDAGILGAPVFGRHTEKQIEQASRRISETAGTAQTVRPISADLKRAIRAHFIKQ